MQVVKAGERGVCGSHFQPVPNPLLLAQLYQLGDSVVLSGTFPGSLWQQAGKEARYHQSIDFLQVLEHGAFTRNNNQAFQSTAPVCASRALTSAGLGTGCTDICFFQGNK